MASVRTTPPAGAATAPGRPRAGWNDDLAAALLGTWVVGAVPRRLGAPQPARPGDLLQPLAPGSTWASWSRRWCWPGSSPATSAAASTRPGPGRLRPRAGRGGSVRGRRGRRRRLAHHVRGRDGRAPRCSAPPPAAARRRPTDGDQPGPLGLVVARPARPLPGPGLLPALWATALTTRWCCSSSSTCRRSSAGPRRWRRPTARRASSPPSSGVASVLVTNLIVVAPVLLLARRWRRRLAP